jgi:protein AroM
MTDTTTRIASHPASRNSRRGSRTIGVLTIGQSPRADRLGEDVRAVLGEDARIIERGALDGMSDAEIAGIAPHSQAEYRLITLLRDGRSVEIGKPAILERLQRHITDLEDNERVDAILVMCTGAFPPFAHRRPLLLPQEALYGAIIGIAGGGRIGALIPLESQRAQALQKWNERGVTDVRVYPASPYSDDPAAEVARASAAAQRDGVTALFMDCFGYDRTMKQVARSAFHGPVVLARTMAARLIAEMSE